MCLGFFYYILIVWGYSLEKEGRELRVFCLLVLRFNKIKFGK